MRKTIIKERIYKNEKKHSCANFRTALKLNMIKHSQMLDESEWFIPGGFHIHFCPFCGKFISEQGWISDVQNKKITDYCCFKFKEALKENLASTKKEEGYFLKRSFFIKYCPFCGKVKKMKNWRINIED